MFVFFSLFLWQSFTIKPEASEIITDPLISMTVGDTKNLYFFHGDSASAYFIQMKPDPYDFEMYLWSNGTSYCGTEGMMAGNISKS